MEEFIKIIESNEKLSNLEKELAKLTGWKTIQECREKLIKSHDFCYKTKDYSIFSKDYEIELSKNIKYHTFIKKNY